MNQKFLAGALVLSAFSPVFLVEAEPARAFSWDRTAESVTVYDGEPQGTFFDVFFYKATVNGNEVDGLNASARFTLDSMFDAANQSATFKVDLSNFSDGNIWNSARLSGIAFDVDPNLDTVSASGDFNKAYIDGKYPEGVKEVEVCYTNGPTCQGGKGAGNGGGLLLGQTGSFYTTLTFDTVATSFDIRLDNFYARWQSLDSKDGEYVGASGVGTGQVPTPALIPAIIGAGVAALRKRKKMKME